MGLARVLRIVLLIGAFVGMPSLAGLAQAQDWPTKPVTLIVPFAPGGTTDIVGRIIAQRLTEKLGQTFVVEISAAPAARSAPPMRRARCPTATPSSWQRSPTPWRRESTSHSPIISSRTSTRSPSL